MAKDERPEEQLADELAAYHDRLAGGRDTAADEGSGVIDPTLLPEWNRLAAFLAIMEKAWPRTEPELDHPWRPVLEGEPLSREGPETDAPAAERRRLFGRFQVLRTLGQGGFGIVFLAWDPALRRQVALKLPQPESLMTPEARKRFQREAHAAAGLDHPNIVPIYESGAVDTVAYIASAYVPGPTLALWLASQTQPVPERDAAKLVATLARAAQHAHERGVLHRDLKPNNILLQHPGDEDPRDFAECALSDLEPRIADFSLARLADYDGPKTVSGFPIGSPPYMAPEQAEGRPSAIGPPTDVYGLGGMLYELLTGHSPFGGESQIETIRHVIHDDPLPPRQLRKEVSPALEAIVLKCLEKLPARRYSAARELADDLDRFLAGEPVRARPPGSWKKLGRSAKRRRVTIAMVTLGVAAAATLIGGKAWFDRRLSETRQAARGLEDRARESELARRRAQYVADIRQVPDVIRAKRTRDAHEMLAKHVPKQGEEDLREFAWYHLWKRCHTERHTLPGHQGDVYSVEFSPRGDLLASAGKDGTVRIWDTNQWRLIRKIDASRAEVNAAGFSPDGRSLATVDDEGKLKLWEVATGNCVRETLAHDEVAVVARFTKDGRQIVTGGRGDRFIRLWDRTTGKLLHEFRYTEGGGVLESAVFSPDGSALAMGGADGVKLWSLEDRRMVPTSFIDPGGEGAQCVAFSHDGKKLAATTEGQGRIQLWDVSTGQSLREFRGHSEGVFSVAFSADDRTIFSASTDQTIRLWDVATGNERGMHLGHIERVWSVTVSPNGRTIVSASLDGTVKIWDPEPARNSYELRPTGLQNFGFSADGRTLLTFEISPRWSVARWDARSGALLERTSLKAAGGPGASSFSADGRLLAVPTGTGTVALYNLASGRQEALSDTAFRELNELSFSPNNRYLLLNLSSGPNGYALWDFAAHRALSAFPGTQIPAAFTASGEVISKLVGRDDFVTWDPATGRSRIASFRIKRNIKGVVPSRDGRLLATAGKSNWISVWSADTLELRTEMAWHHVRQGQFVFSPDAGTLAASSDPGGIRLSNVVTGEELVAFEGFSNSIWWHRFSPDGKTLAAWGVDHENEPGFLRVWVAADRQSVEEALQAQVPR